MTPETGLIVVASDDITIYSVNRLETQSFNPPSDIISASIAAHSVITVNDARVTQYAVKEVQSLKLEGLRSGEYNDHHPSRYPYNSGMRVRKPGA